MKKPVVIFSGAGLSADSGIPTFRGTDGLWENHKIEEVAEHQAWFKDKELVLRFYKERYENYVDCKPHVGHEAIVKLQERFKVLNITQNIDNLLEKAGCESVRHLHGRLDWAKCEWHDDIQTLKEPFSCDYKVKINKPIELGDICDRCGGQLRPDVVWFGEAVDMPHEFLAGLIRAIKASDGVFISVGTSIQVTPASMLVPWFSQVRRKHVIDPELPQWRVSEYNLISKTAAEGLPELVEQLMEEEDEIRPEERERSIHVLDGRSDQGGSEDTHPWFQRPDHE